MRLLVLTLLCLPAWFSSAVAEDNTPDNLSETSREIIQTFADRLQKELQQAMSEGGPVKAIDICKVRAPKIAAELSTDGWLVKRTSLRPRNPLNGPDEFERRTLLDFEQKRDEGRAMENLAYYKMKQFKQDGKELNEFRYMKAIPTRNLCLTCHGENIPDNVLKKLDTLYPDDQARGYQAGDIRGAFSLRKRFEATPLDSVNSQQTYQTIIDLSRQTIIAQP